MAVVNSFFPLWPLCPGVIPVNMWLGKWDFTDEIKVASQLTLKPRDYPGEPYLIKGTLKIRRGKQKSQPPSQRNVTEQAGEIQSMSTLLLALRMKGATGLGMMVVSRSCKWSLANSHRRNGTSIPQQHGTKFCQQPEGALKQTTPQSPTLPVLCFSTLYNLKKQHELLTYRTIK